MDIDNEISKTVVYKNGDTLNIITVREALIAYWKMTASEKRSFMRMVEKYQDVPDKYKPSIES